jgi:hypothetical protein
MSINEAAVEECRDDMELFKEDILIKLEDEIELVSSCSFWEIEFLLLGTAKVIVVFLFCGIISSLVVVGLASWYEDDSMTELFVIDVVEFDLLCLIRGLVELSVFFNPK